LTARPTGVEPVRRDEVGLCAICGALVWWNRRDQHHEWHDLGTVNEEVRYRVTLVGAGTDTLRGHVETAETLRALADAVKPLGWLVVASIDTGSEQ
jgi:hypothetical protein